MDTPMREAAGKAIGLERFGFPISPDQREIHETMRRFGRDRLAPGAADRDRDHRFPTAEIGELARMGGMAMKAAPDDDGPGLDNTAYALSIEALAEADPSVAVVTVASNLAMNILSLHANEDQRARFLRPVARGERGAASFGLTEPHAGSDAAAIKTHARREGGDWILSGAKQWITGAAAAEVFVIFAKTDPGSNAVSCFVVEKGTAGFELGRIEDKMGLRSSGTAQLFFDNCRIPGANLVGNEGEGYRLAIGALAPSRIAIAAQSIGIAERAFALGLDYARERQVFGGAVSDLQVNRHALADARTELDQAWLLMLRGARLLDDGYRVAEEASMAKLAASEICGRVVDRMLQLHGGNGYSREYEIERLYRDARVMRIYEGTSEIQREIIARAVVDGGRG